MKTDIQSSGQDSHAALQVNVERKKKTTLDKLPQSLKFHALKKNAYADQFESAGLVEVADNLRACTETETLICCSHCGGHWWTVTHCDLRVCPLCSWKQSQDRARYITALTAQMQFPKLLTLTLVRWTGDPRRGIRWIRHCFMKLRRSKVFKNVIGGAYQIELKQKKDGWHIHIHVICESPYLPRQLVWNKWREITDQRIAIVDIRAARSKAQRAYVCKYVVKSADVDESPGGIVAWYLATKGSRLFGTFGKWFNKAIEELLNLEIKPETKAACPLCENVGSIFFARDGPFIFGWEAWRLVAKAYGADEDCQRDRA